jgi:hypothetical protein
MDRYAIIPPDRANSDFAHTALTSLDTLLKQHPSEYASEMLEYFAGRVDPAHGGILIDMILQRLPSLQTADPQIDILVKAAQIVSARMAGDLNETTWRDVAKPLQTLIEENQLEFARSHDALNRIAESINAAAGFELLLLPRSQPVTLLRAPHLKK